MFYQLYQHMLNIVKVLVQQRAVGEQDIVPDYPIDEEVEVSINYIFVLLCLREKA